MEQFPTSVSPVWLQIPRREDLVDPAWEGRPPHPPGLFFTSGGRIDVQVHTEEASPKEEGVLLVSKPARREARVLLEEGT